MNIILKLLFISLLFSLSLLAKEIKPAFILKSRGLVNDFVLDDFHLYTANNEGSVEIFDIRTQKKVDEILLPSHINVRGDDIPAKVLSVDRLGGKTLIVSTDIDGYRDVWLHDGKKLKSLINKDDKITVKEARFINAEEFMYGTLGYDVTRHSTGDSSYRVYSDHIEESAFSDLAMSEDKKSMVTASESGRVTLIEVKTGKILNSFESLNVDNIYKLDYKNGTIITAGQDRRVGVYPKVGKPYYLKSNFLVYSVGLSPSAKIGVYSANEHNDLQIFDVKSGEKMDILKGHDSVPSTIKFFNEDGFFSAGFGYHIYYWHLGHDKPKEYASPSLTK